MGKVQIDLEKLAAFMRMKPTLADTAAFFECSVDSVERFIKTHTKLKFAEFREQKMVHTRMSLVRTAIRKAEGGDNVMLIFCLKNLCGWRDRQPDEVGQVNVNVSTMSDAELVKILETYKKENEPLKKAGGGGKKGKRK